MKNYKEKIIAFIEGKADPDAFYTWFESTPQVLDWLQSMIPSDKTTTAPVEEKIDYFLKNFEKQTQDEIYSAYHSFCHSLENNDGEQISRAEVVINLLCSLDSKTAKFTTLMNLLLSNFRNVLAEPDRYKPSYVQHILESVKEFFEATYHTVREVPYNVKTVYSHNKRKSKLWTYVNIQSWLHNLMTEFYPDEDIKRDDTLHAKASFMLDVCPEYIEGLEVDEAGIIENIIAQVPETLPKGKRTKQIKELIKKEFHIQGTKYPRWVQSGEWPVSKNGKPMRFVEQKRKKGKGYENMLYTIFVFEDVDTLEIRTIEQYT